MARAPRNRQPLLYMLGLHGSPGPMATKAESTQCGLGAMQSLACADNQLYVARQGHMLQGQRVHRVE